MKYKNKVLVATAAFILAAAATLIPIGATYNVEAETEVVSFVVTDAVPVTWELGRFAIFPEGSTKAKLLEGSFQPCVSCRVSIEHISNGPLRIRSEAQNGGNQGNTGVILLSGESKSRPLGPGTVIRLDDISQRALRGDSVVLPITGNVVIGSTAEFANTAAVPILRKGQIRIFGLSVFDRTLFDAGTLKLVAGDRVTLGTDQVPPAISQGIVVLNEKPAMTVITRVASDHITVDRFKSKGFEVRATLVDRVKGDGAIQAIWAVSGTLIAVVGWMIPTKNKTEED